MFLHLLIAVALASGIIAVVTFVLYARARMKEDEEKEKLFLKIHYTCLFTFFLLGIIFMLFMVETGT